MGFFSKREKKTVHRPAWKAIAEDRLRELTASQNACADWGSRYFACQDALEAERSIHAETRAQLLQLTADYQALQRSQAEETSQ